MIGLNGMSLRNGRRLIKKINHKSGKINLRKFIVFSFISILLFSLAAVSLQPIPVLAAGGVSTTIKSIIISLVASLGLSPSSASFSNALENNDIMNRSIETIAEGTTTAADIDNALTSMGVDVTNITDILANSADDVSNVVSNAPAGTDTSAFTGLGAATAGQNIVASAQHAAETGEVGAAIGGSAVGLFNGLGWAIPIIWGQQVKSNAMQQMEKIMSSGADYNTTDNIVNKMKAGCHIGRVKTVIRDTGAPGYTYVWIVGDTILLPVYPDNGEYFRPYNYGNSLCDYAYYRIAQNGSITTYADSTLGADRAAGHSISNYPTSYEEVISYSGFEVFESRNAYNVRLNQLKASQDKQVSVSPDIIGQLGNQKGTWTIENNTNVFNFPDINPIININNNQYMKPIDWDDFKNWQNTANTNTENGDIGEETQGFDFQDFINTYKNTYEQSQPPIIDPEANTNPYIPAQPTQAPKPTASPEQMTENIETMGTIDLKDVFPFCIPWDLYLMMTKFEVSREAPHLDVVLDLGPAGQHHIDIDFDDFSEVAAILRALELIVFIVGLALAARKLIGG